MMAATQYRLVAVHDNRMQWHGSQRPRVSGAPSRVLLTFAPLTRQHRVKTFYRQLQNFCDRKNANLVMNLITQHQLIEVLRKYDTTKTYCLSEVPHVLALTEGKAFANARYAQVLIKLGKCNIWQYETLAHVKQSLKGEGIKLEDDFEVALQELNVPCS